MVLHSIFPREWIPSFAQLIQIYFILIITIAISTATLPVLRESILSYGKLDNVVQPPEATTSTLVPSKTRNIPGLIAAVQNFRVPKRWFSHFYLFATLWTIYLTLDLYWFTSGSSKYHPNLSLLSLLQWLGFIAVNPSYPRTNLLSVLSPSVQWSMLAYLIHTIRRWYETWYIERPSPTARINVGHYIIGITFYAAMAPAIWIDSVERTLSWNQSSTSVISQEWSNTGKAQFAVGLALFLWASRHQHQCHRILANLRAPASSSPSSKQTNSQEYKVPFGDWFQYLVTPHYSAEMLLYLGLYFMVTSSSVVTPTTCPTLLIAWVWVVVNLGIVSRETDAWYKTRFGPEYGGKHCRRTLIPFVY
ncbi:MAG: 3-oxo-5-alpha-steroid 4-dehydrogenase-domain-containing protein [Podila humilis]|nr:MAG: 3-oxo-5-alpha-steroid 4-dehydrogenase-domain-containing protein [Podila humilis]